MPVTFSVLAAPENPELGECLGVGFGLRTENPGQAAREGAFGAEHTHQRTGRAREQSLHRAWTMCLREESAVEQADRFDDEGIVTVAAAVVGASEQFLRHGVAVIVRQDVVATDPVFAEQLFVQVGLIGDGVVVVAGFGRPAEADHVGGDHPGESGAQARPDRVPIPGRGRETVDTQ